MGESEASHLTESFNKAAGTYECRMGTATRTVARHIAATLALPAHAAVCDNACGTGAVTEAILTVYPDATVTATDASAGMIDIMTRTKAEQGWGERVQTAVVDSVQLGSADETFDAHVMNFGIFFTSDDVQAAREIYRTLKSGGTAVVTCWKEAALFKMLFEMQEVVGPATRIESLPMLEKWMERATMESVLHAAGFEKVEMETWPVVVTGQTIEELTRSCAENMKGIIGSQWTAEEIGKIDAATEKVLRSGRWLAVDTPYCKGVSWIAWIATARK